MPLCPMFGKQGTQRQQYLLIRWTYRQLQLADLETIYLILFFPRVRDPSQKDSKEKPGPKQC